jgi:hypothetical protein
MLLMQPAFIQHLGIAAANGGKFTSRTPAKKLNLAKKTILRQHHTKWGKPSQAQQSIEAL